jgi:hypothetical protein
MRKKNSRLGFPSLLYSPVTEAEGSAHHPKRNAAFSDVLAKRYETLG